MKKIVVLLAAFMPLLSWAQYDLLRMEKRTDANLKGPVYQVVSNMHSLDDDSCWSIASSATYSFSGLKVASTEQSLAGFSSEQYFYAGNRMTACEKVGKTNETYKFEYNDLGRLRKMVVFFMTNGEADSIVANIESDVKGRPAKMATATDTYNYEYTKAGQLDMEYHYIKDGENLSRATSYDADGRPIRVLESKTNGPVRSIVYSYNKNGDPVEVTTTTWDPASKVIYHYEYPAKPDENGNWTMRRVTITTNGKKVHCIENRGLIYFK